MLKNSRSERRVNLEYLIRLLSVQQPRRVKVIENILENRRTVTNLFWGLRYGLLPYLGIDHNFQRTEFEMQVVNYQRDGLATFADNHLLLTKAGVQFQTDYLQKHYQPTFTSDYLTYDYHLAELLILLATQVMSEFSFDNRRYEPVLDNDHVMMIVKQWFHRLDKTSAVEMFSSELTEALSTLTDQQARFISTQLTGHGVPGFSIGQAIEQDSELTTDDAVYLNADIWTGIAKYFDLHNGIIHDLLQITRRDSPVSRSAQVTYQQFLSGKPLETIAHQRRLKIGTIREHLLENAIFMGEDFDYARIFNVDQLEQFKASYSGNIDDWHVQANNSKDPQIFFYFRLYQIMRSYEEHDE